MKVKIRDIGPGGREIRSSLPGEGWFESAVVAALPHLYRSGDKADLKFSIKRIGDTLELAGEVAVVIRPFCARCADEFDLPLRVPLRRMLVPRAATVGGALEKGEDPDDAEDMEWGHYSGDELDIDPIVSEELVLALPLTFLCRPDCRGLCLACGDNLNRGPCRCGKA